MRARHVALPLLSAFAGILMTAAAAGPVHGQDAKAPAACVGIWKEIGIPEERSVANIAVICHLGYVVGYNKRSKTPDWVIERLTPSETKGKATREDQDFKAEDDVGKEFQAQPADYDGSGLDKGHNAPAADFAGNQKMLDDTFVLSNAVPQVGAGFNRSIWRSLETQIRNTIGNNHEALYVITGSVAQEAQPIKIDDICGTNLTLPTIKPVAICAGENKDSKETCAAGVAVPAAMFKIVYDPAVQNAYAVLMENKNHTGLYKSGQGTAYIRAHKVSIATIEDLTGLRFFTALPDRKHRQMRASCVEPKLH